MAADIPQSEIDYQLSHADEYNASGLPAFVIVGMVICTIAVGLRLWGRRKLDIPLKADDYTLVAGLILTICAHSCMLHIHTLRGLGRHLLVMPKENMGPWGKTAYAWNIIYTIAYPTCRISLVLLYRRVFIQTWFRGVCWILIGCYIGYAVGSAFADAFQVIPVAANWDQTVKVTNRINNQKLYLANVGFNIGTDAVLLVLPLTVIWSMHMGTRHKLGFSLVFCLGVLTLLASVFRFYYTATYDVYDPTFALTKGQWWTTVENYFGLLCPCLVTLGPLIRCGYLAFSRNLSPHVRSRIDHLTGFDSSTAGVSRRNVKSESDETGSTSYRHLKDPNDPTNNSSLRSKESKLEAQVAEDDAVPAVPNTNSGKGVAGERGGDGMAVDQGVAIANLDPRVKAHKKGKKGRMGSSAQAAKAEEGGADVPERGIGVSRDWRLESETGSAESPDGR